MTNKKKDAIFINPGSDEAIKLGCVCPILDNAHGKGNSYKGKSTFWIIEDCPLHGKKVVNESEKKE